MTTEQTDGLDSIEEPKKELKYAVNFRALNAMARPPAFMVRSRCCWQCQQMLDEMPEEANDLKFLLKQIGNDCSQRHDYLLPGTTLTEAVFRLMLAMNNRPLTIAEIQEQLSAAWASVIYMKDLSEELLERLLNSQNDYMIEAVKK